MNDYILFGILLIVSGVLLFVVTEAVLLIKLNKFNREWEEGVEDYEMPKL